MLTPRVGVQIVHQIAATENEHSFIGLPRRKETAGIIFVISFTRYCCVILMSLHAIVNQHCMIYCAPPIDLAAC